MRIRTGAVQQGRTIEVELDDSDGEVAFTNWGEMSTADRFKKLSAKADSLVVYYLVRENLIPTTYAQERMQALNKVMKA